MFKPRPKQEEVLAFTKGRMGVSAVPGSGKTKTLSYLAAQLIATAPLSEGQEVLVVTLVNSAVGNFARQVGDFIREKGLLPGYGYRVRTLHGLANDIVRERPTLAGLADDFEILDERIADEILQDAADSWLRTHADLANEYLSPDQFENYQVRQNYWPTLVRDVSRSFIKQAKDLKLDPVQINELRAAYRGELPLVDMGAEVYAAYERGLRYRGAVDFQDLIRLALKVLESDDALLARLQHRWPYILEDEAQDSSKLQEDILRLLVGNSGNWVRVGDPNQAIYETFTTANPKYLREFLDEVGVQPRELPNSGRSTGSIIRLANGLIDWSLKHPTAAIRAKQPLTPPHIELTPPGDPQGNPPDAPEMIFLRAEKYTPEQERTAVIQSLQKWLPDNQDKTVAVLLPINSSGSKMVDELRSAEIDYVENLRTTTTTRAVVGSVLIILNFLTDPKDSNLLSGLYRVWRRDERSDPELEQEIIKLAGMLRRIKKVEDFIAPRGTDWLAESVSDVDEEPLYRHFREFQTVVQHWQSAANLPVDQLIITISSELFTRESDIATAYSLALYMRRYADSQPEARLPEFAEELRAIARNQRNFTGLSDDDDGFDPDQHKGKVTVTTMHKAKGLEWDRVYLMSVNNYDFPSAESYDSYIGEKWFIRDRLNMESEALGQLEAIVSGEPYVEGEATQAARIEYSAERLRLLYVGITRARRELVITWNTGHRGEQIEALPLAALRGLWSDKK